MAHDHHPGGDLDRVIGDRAGAMARARRSGSPLKSLARLPSFAGIWAPWTSVRKLKEGKVTAEFFGF